MDSLAEFFVHIVNDYFKTFNIEVVIPEYVFASDMLEAYLNKRPDLANEIRGDSDELNQYNGFTVPPKSVGGTFVVLLNRTKLVENLKNGDLTWIGTITHENTHIIDFMNYAKITNVSDYDELLSIDKNAMFLLWTEFNAKSKGYFFVRKYSFENMYDPSQIPHIVNTELPFQEQLLRENFHATTNGYKQAYLVANYLGRLFALHQIFPEYFTDGLISKMDIFKNNGWMLEWYYFLCSHSELDIAYECFDDMKKILSKNFSGI